MHNNCKRARTCASCTQKQLPGHMLATTAALMKQHVQATITAVKFGRRKARRRELPALYSDASSGGNCMDHAPIKRRAQSQRTYPVDVKTSCWWA